MSSPPEAGSTEPRAGGSEALVGVVLSGRYRIDRLIGEGGMGAVYQAEHTHMHKRLAVKVLHPEMSRQAEVVARFEREAMAAAHIEHPNVAAATDFGKLDDGSFFLVLEYVEGRSLRDALSEGRLELGRACHVTRQIAGALGRAHALGIVHRDLKPENVMLVARDDDPAFVKVLDFGIAKVPIGAFAGGSNGQVLTQLGMVYGTPEYMAPEQALGQEVDARADLYSLGVMLFEMVTGKRPFDNDSKVALLGMHVTASVPRMGARAPDAGVPPELDAIVTRLMAKEAAARFADSRELVDALDAVTSALADAGRIADPRPPEAQGGPRSSTRTGVAARSQAGLALGPTSLAQPAATPLPGDGGPGRGLAVRAGALLGALLEAAPPWVTPRLAAVAAGGVAVLLVVVAVVVSGRGGGAPATSGGPAASAHPRPPDPKVDDRVAAAKAKVDRGDFGAAIDALAALERKHGDRPDVHMLLWRAYAGDRRPHDALREAGLWLDADPAAAADPKLQEDVRNAALVRDTQDEAFALLEAKMGAPGVDLLYDVAYGASGRQYGQAAAHARRSLDADDVRARASPALAVLLDLRAARSCEGKRALLDRAKADGDARVLPVLQPLQATRGCGFLSLADCYSCLHKDQALKDAIAAVSARAP